MWCFRFIKVFFFSHYLFLSQLAHANPVVTIILPFALEGDRWRVAGTFDTSTLQQELDRPSCKRSSLALSIFSSLLSNYFVFFIFLLFFFTVSILYICFLCSFNAWHPITNIHIPCFIFFFFIVHYLFRFISLQFSWIIFFNFIISTLFPNSSSISILYFIYLIYSLCSIVYSTVVIYCFLDCHRFCFCVVIFINIIIADFNLDPRRYNFFLFSKTFFFRIAIYKYVTKYTMDISKSWT